MTHPLVSAFHRRQKLNQVALIVPVGVDLVLERKLRDVRTYIDELMASIPQISCYVGFYHGANNKPFIIWLWPLSDIAEYSFCDGAYYRHDEDPLISYKVVLSHFLHF